MPVPLVEGDDPIADPLVKGRSGEAPVALTRFAWLSIAAALATITLKTAAFALTGSVGLLSDALESVVNLVAAIVVLVVLRRRRR